MMRLNEFYEMPKNHPPCPPQRPAGHLDPDIFQRMKMISAFVDCVRNINMPNDVVSLHSHDFYEISLFLSGKLRYLADNKRYQIEKKDILIVPPGFTHCPLALHTLTEPYERIITCVSKDFINFFLSKWHAQNVYKTILNRPTLFKTSGTPYEFLCRYLEYNAIEANLESPYADAFLAGNTLCFLSKLMEAHDIDFAPTRRLKKELIDNIISYVKKNYSKKITIQTIADEFHIGKTALLKLFKKNFNCTFHQYLNLIRLNAAKNMLAEDLNLETISEAVGFNDYSGFYRAFKKEFGLSPRKYYAQIHSSAITAEY